MRHKGWYPQYFILPAMLVVTAYVQPFQNQPTMARLVGQWQMRTTNGFIMESWKQVSGTALEGTSYRVANNSSDTVYLERIEIKTINGVLHYVPTVLNQNDQQPVPFALTAYSNDRFVFENPQHDYPKRIIYRFVNNDSLVARIEGSEVAKFSEYYYRRIQ